MAINIAIKRGDTKRHTFNIKDDAGLVVDLSAWTAFVMAVNPSNKPEDAALEVGKIAGALTTDGTDGRCSFVPPGDWAVGKYYYDVQAIDANGDKLTFADGRYTIEQDIAKD